MDLLKIALVNLNPTVGAIRRNLEKAIDIARETSEARCGLVAFTEQVLPGYPTEDLVLWPGFVAAQFEALREFAEASGKLSFPSLFTVGLTVSERGLLYNAVAVVAAGKILGIVPATDEEKNKARRVAFLASRTNTMLSMPMLFFMIASGGLFRTAFFGG